MEVFHDGERQLQLHTGSRQRLAVVGERLILNEMPDQHRRFFSRLPFVIAAAADGEGQPWATLLCNPPGFITSPDPRTLVIDAMPPVTDPLRHALAPGARIALLGIEQQTRRRNRANGVVREAGATGFSVAVEQSFGNCPQYIRPRQAEYGASRGMPRCHVSPRLSREAKRIIAAADTLFIASGHPQSGSSGVAAHGLDVSHRGGSAGFVHIAGERTLLLPDYGGNGFFNTLGNITLNPRAGLLFIDFDSGALLQMTAQAGIIFAGAELDTFPQAERLLRLDARHVIHTEAALPLRWGEWPSLSGAG